MFPSKCQQLRFISTTRKLLTNLSIEEVEKSKLDILNRSIIKPVIGLEVHAQLNTKSKLFSEASNDPRALPNSQLDLFDVSLPGTLPKLNRNAVRAAITTGLSLNCTIQDEIHFDRKNYFYSDMPAGYQITQYNKPIALNGHLDFIVSTYHNSLIAHSQQYDIAKYLYHEDRMLEEVIAPYMKRSRIKQIQLEQDSAKTLHQMVEGQHDEELNNLIDYNRCGSALIEIVFEPDLSNPHEASSLVRELIIVLKSLKICECRLQEGSLRVDANVSVSSINDQLFDKTIANRVELKNLNSLRSMNKAIDYEIRRQSSLLLSGKTVAQESRTYDSRTGKTVLLRLKESTVDYRYVPEPSIPPLKIDATLVNELKESLSNIKLPQLVRDTLINTYKLDLILVIDLINEPGLSEYFMNIIEGLKSNQVECGSNVANTVADFLIYSINNLKSIEQKMSILKLDLVNGESEFMRKLSVSKMVKLFEMMFNDEISFAIAYEVMKCLSTNDEKLEPREVVERFNWFQVHDINEVEEHCKQIIAGMKNTSKQYKKKGDKKYLRLMLEKLAEISDNKVSIKTAIECFNKLLRNG